MPIAHQLGKLVQKTSLYPLARNLYKRLDLERSYYPKHRENLGQILAFEDVPVVPYESLLDRFSGLSVHQGGPIWPDWSAQIEARHCRNLSPIDDFPDLPENIAEMIEEPVVWGGAICHHFGHQVADFCTRILHAKSVYPDAKFLFAAKSSARIRSLEQTPSFFRALLDWYGLARSQVKIVSQPLLAKHLLVAPQAEQLSNYGPSADYLDLVDAHVSQQLMSRKLIVPARRRKAAYISRAGMPSHFAGEPYVESLMHKCGIHIIRPETQPLPVQLAEYMAVRQLIFSAGSALHGLQLLGRFHADVQVINRRVGGRLAKNMIEARAHSLTYLDSVQSVLHGFTPSGLINDWKGITVHNEERLVASLRSVHSELAHHWDSAIYAECRDRDIIDWIKREVKPGGSLRLLPAKKVVSQLRKAQLSHLVPAASECLM